MRLKHTIIPLTGMLLLLCCQPSSTEQNKLLISSENRNIKTNNAKIDTIKTLVFKTENGWGYNISIDEKIYIHQSCIPGISGTKSFSTPKNAEKVAKYVAAKFKKTYKLPSISYQELDSLGVL